MARFSVAALLAGAGIAAAAPEPAAAATLQCRDWNTHQQCADVAFRCRWEQRGGAFTLGAWSRECRGEGWAGWFVPGQNVYVRWTAYEWDFQTPRASGENICWSSDGGCYVDSGWYYPWSFGPENRSWLGRDVMFCVHAGVVGQPATDVGTCSITGAFTPLTSTK